MELLTLKKLVPLDEDNPPEFSADTVKSIWKLVTEGKESDDKMKGSSFLIFVIL